MALALRYGCYAKRGQCVERNDSGDPFGGLGEILRAKSALQDDRKRRGLAKEPARCRRYKNEARPHGLGGALRCGCYTEARPVCSVTMPAVQDSKATPPKPDRSINCASSVGAGKRATDSGR